MFVSSYEKSFRDAFQETLSELDVEPFEASVKKIVERLAEDVVDRVHDDVRDRLVTAIEDSICEKAAEYALQMLESALAGDDQSIRDLMGFYSYPPGSRKHLVDCPDLVQGWKLISGLMERRPDIFVDERIAQLNETVAAKQDQIDRLWKQVHELDSKLAAALAESREP